MRKLYSNEQILKSIYIVTKYNTLIQIYLIKKCSKIMYEKAMFYRYFIVFIGIACWIFYDKFHLGRNLAIKQIWCTQFFYTLNKNWSCLLIKRINYIFSFRINKYLFYLDANDIYILLLKFKNGSFSDKPDIAH